jgi:endonuclease/exonuclease/phosphatase family metal-dependent hydrolase
VRKTKIVVPLGLFFLIFLFVLSVNLYPESFVRYQEPEFLSFDELKSLLSNPHPTGKLGEKLNRFWTTPVISNEAYEEGIRPHPAKSPLLGKFLRVASWNIEESIETPRAIEIFTSADAMHRMLDPAKVPDGSDLAKKVSMQRNRLAHADILLLEEMTIGTKNTDYIDATREIARALKMNYVYGAEQLQIDPVLLGLEKVHYEEGTNDEEASQYYAVDPKRYKGVTGCAVLSRYPIKHAEVFQLKTQPYDWYGSEKDKTGFLEKARRFGAKEAFENRVTREIKIGGRIFFRVDLEVPELPEKTLTVINVHLEIKCEPKGREEQMGEILSNIQKIRHPVIVMGDFNSASEDLSPTSVTRVVKGTLKNPTTWFSMAIQYGTPYGNVVNPLRWTSTWTKNFNDPTARHIPVIAPNSVRGLFNEIEEFRFEDGGAFDFRGNAERSIGAKDGVLANSNQRGHKGFKTTFRVKRPWGIIGKYRLDWVFVKAFLRDPRDPEGSYRFSPHYGETLEELCVNLRKPISDHYPNVVDLPFEEPNLSR